MTTRVRVAICAVVVLLLAGGAFAYVRLAAARSAGDAPSGAFSLTGPALVVRDTADGSGYGHATAVTGGTRTVAEPECARIYAAGGTGVCLRPSKEAIGAYQIAVFDSGAARDQGDPDERGAEQGAGVPVGHGW